MAMEISSLLGVIGPRVFTIIAKEDANGRDRGSVSRVTNQNAPMENAPKLNTKIVTPLIV